MLNILKGKISHCFRGGIAGRLNNIIVGLKTLNDNFSLLMKFLMTSTRSEKICLYDDFDDLKMYHGYNIKINDYITIKQPSLEEITKYGDIKYYSMIHTLCSVGADLKWQLDDLGVDYTKIDDFELFYSLIVKEMPTEKTKILFGDIIDLSKMKLVYNKQIEENVLIQVLDENNYIQIDKYTYACIVNTLRKMHYIKRNDEIPGNEATRLILVEDARDEYEANKNKIPKSPLLSLISSMVNSEGFKHNDEDVFEMKIYTFMDSVYRIGKIKNAELLLQSGYSGFGVDLKKINKDEINWMGDL